MAINSFARAGLPTTNFTPNADFSNTATGTLSDSGINYKYITFTGSGTLTVTKAGLADVLVVAGGGGGANFLSRATGGGCGEVHYVEKMFLEVAEHTVTVGAGGAGASVEAAFGNLSSIGSIAKAGRGAGACSAYSGAAGAARNGGGGGNGGFWDDGVQSPIGSGAGLSTWGGATLQSGRSLSITGTSVEYGIGGHTGTNATANRGGGGFNSGNGGSGVVNIRVRV